MGHLNGQTGCPGCVVELPELPEDTIYLAPAPNGQVGVAYDNDVSFRMPISTDPVAAVDPDVPGGVALESITVLSVTNVPPGLNWELDRTEFELPEITDGCIKFCGTPLQPGLYFVEVIVEAQVFFISEVASFEFPILIEPGVSNTDGFSIVNNTGCGSVTASFTNNNPSNGEAGFSYVWDFGNGNGSIDENPADQVYTEPGVYEVGYRAIVDTSGAFLTKMTILSASCDDIFNNAPDFMFKIFDAENVEVFTSNTLDNISPPVSFTLNFAIGDGNFRLDVIDDDQGINGGDDLCGSVNFNRLTQGVLTSGDLSVELEIFTPIDTIAAVDTITVFEQPSPPIIEGLPTNPLCVGDMLNLTTNFFTNIQWYRDSLALVGETISTLQVGETGDYYVTYTTEDGCFASSDPATIIFNELPDFPVFTNENNLLKVFDTEALPAEYALQWFLNGTEIPGETDTVFCIPATANYSLEVTDLSTNCSNTYSQAVSFDSNFPGCITSVSDLSNVLSALQLFPNPVSQSEVHIQISAKHPMQLDWNLFNSMGQALKGGIWEINRGSNTPTIDVTNLTPGVYFLSLSSDNQASTLRFVRK